jgi:hypothetical protein
MGERYVRRRCSGHIFLLNFVGGGDGTFGESNKFVTDQTDQFVWEIVQPGIFATWKGNWDNVSKSDFKGCRSRS